MNALGWFENHGDGRKVGNVPVLFRGRTKFTIKLVSISDTGCKVPANVCTKLSSVWYLDCGTLSALVKPPLP